MLKKSRYLFKIVKVLFRSNLKGEITKQRNKNVNNFTKILILFQIFKIIQEKIR